MAAGFPCGGQVGAQGVDDGQARDGGAEEADVTERAGRCQMAAEEGAAADAHIESIICVCCFLMTR